MNENAPTLDATAAASPVAELPAAMVPSDSACPTLQDMMEITLAGMTTEKASRIRQHAESCKLCSARLEAFEIAVRGDFEEDLKPYHGSVLELFRTPFDQRKRNRSGQQTPPDTPPAGESPQP